MRRKRCPGFSAVLYVLAGLLTLYAVWAAVHSFGYVSRMVAARQLVVRGNEFEIASFHMSNFAQYVLSAVILFALGRILQVSTPGTAATDSPAPAYRELVPAGADDDDDNDEDELEDWFESSTKSP